MVEVAGTDVLGDVVVVTAELLGGLVVVGAVPGRVVLVAGVWLPLNPPQAPAEVASSIASPTGQVLWGKALLTRSS